MPNSDYKAATGGALKLKGASVTKKKKKKSKATDGESSKERSSKSQDLPNTNEDGSAEASNKTLTSTLEEEDDLLRGELEKDMKEHGRTKTEAERRFEEQRRKRLDERLKRDGVKTHKERVEELNRYLSKMSEHHDMPRIGPG